MNKNPALEIPIRSKIEMLNEIILIMQYLQEGKRKKAEPLIRDLKIRSIFLNEQIQGDVLIFCEQIQFQYVYDPNHNVTHDVEKAADKLIEDLGFNLKKIKKPV